MTKSDQSEDLRLIAQLREADDLRTETREELGWIEEDIRNGDVSRQDLAYLRKLSEELLGGAPEATQRSGKVIRVCFVGDSITNGTGDDSYQGWAARVSHTAWDDGHDVTFIDAQMEQLDISEILSRVHGCRLVITST